MKFYERSLQALLSSAARRPLACSRENRFARPNRRAYSQATIGTIGKLFTSYLSQGASSLPYRGKSELHQLSCAIDNESINDIHNYYSLETGHWMN